MRRPQLSVRGKIVGTIIIVSTVVLALGAWAAFRAVTTTGGRGGAVLDKHFDRYKANLATLGTSDYATARVIATDPGLVAALGAADAALIAEAAKRVVEPLQSTIAPDLVTFSDASGNVFAAEGLKSISTDEYRTSRLFGDLREGKGIRGKLAILGGKAYRVSGASIRQADAAGGHKERIVGTGLIWQILENWIGDGAAHTGSVH